MVDFARAWNTLVFSRSRKRSKSQEWMPKVLTDEPKGRIWLSVTHPNIMLRPREPIYDNLLHSRFLMLSGFIKVTWEKLDKNLLQQLNQQASSLLFIISQLKTLDNVLHLSVHLEWNKGQQFRSSQ